MITNVGVVVNATMAALCVAAIVLSFVVRRRWPVPDESRRTMWLLWLGRLCCLAAAVINGALVWLFV